jgi:hypothetical protein
MRAAFLTLVAALACGCGGDGGGGEANAPSGGSGGACDGLVKWSELCYQLASERPGDGCDALAGASAAAAKEKLELSDDAAVAMGKLCGLVCVKQRGGASQADVESSIRSSCGS